MSDRQRHVPHTGSRDPAGDADAPDRESRVEQLLLAGLDQYFAGRYEQAIDIWTRVAFLDRRNSRAKAYIERARGLVAERQRETEALVHEGVAAYHAGDLTGARTLLMRAVDRGGHSDTAQLFLDRLQRAEPAPSVTPATLRSPVPAPSRQSYPRWIWTVTIAVSITLAAAILVAARPVASFIAELPLAAPSPARIPVEPLPIALASDRVLQRARTLRAEGRLRDALRALSAVDVADPRRDAADALESEIQREILTGLEPSSPARDPGTAPEVHP
jgi:tetratricopeptide (TPR) repeat protein